MTLPSTSQKVFPEGGQNFYLSRMKHAVFDVKEKLGKIRENI